MFWMMDSDALEGAFVSGSGGELEPVVPCVPVPEGAARGRHLFDSGIDAVPGGDAGHCMPQIGLHDERCI